MKDQIEWIQESIRLVCVNDGDIAEEERKQQFDSLKERYDTFTETERQNIKNIINDQFEINDKIYIYSYFLQYMKTDDFQREVLLNI